CDRRFTHLLRAQRPEERGSSAPVQVRPLANPVKLVARRESQPFEQVMDTGPARTLGIEGAVEADLLRRLGYPIEVSPFPVAELLQAGQKRLNTGAARIGRRQADRKVETGEDNAARRSQGAQPVEQGVG